MRIVIWEQKRTTRTWRRKPPSDIILQVIWMMLMLNTLLCQVGTVMGWWQSLCLCQMASKGMFYWSWKAMCKIRWTDPPQWVSWLVTINIKRANSHIQANMFKKIGISTARCLRCLILSYIEGEPLGTTCSWFRPSVCQSQYPRSTVCTKTAKNKTRQWPD